MIGYVTIGSNDLSSAALFFDSVLGALGGERLYALEHMIVWRFAPGGPTLMVTRPFNGSAAKPGNGTMVALLARDTAEVDRVHALALRMGAADEGAPGPRGKRFYGGYFRDPDGNKFNVHVAE